MNKTPYFGRKVSYAHLQPRDPGGLKNYNKKKIHYNTYTIILNSSNANVLSHLHVYKLAFFALVARIRCMSRN